MIESLIISLILTIIIEVPIAILLGVRNKNDIKIAIWANVLTNPAVVFISNCSMLIVNQFWYSIIVAILEILAVIVEFWVYNNFLVKYKNSPFKLSLICNAISFLAGIVINKLWFK